MHISCPMQHAMEQYIYEFFFFVVVLGCTDSQDSYTYIQSNTKFRKCCEFCPGRLIHILSENQNHCMEK